MALSDVKAVKVPKGTVFYFAAFLAVFYFFFTTPKTETETETETGQRPKRSRSFYR